MQHDDGVYLGHMLDTARQAVEKLGSRTRTEFDADEDLQVILLHRVQIIGEAASRVSPATRDAHPRLPWKRIVGMRHRIVHDYLNIDLDILWEVVSSSPPELIRLLSPSVPPQGA
jgi:uncharacterized protein with HEPN domain